VYSRQRKSSTAVLQGDIGKGDGEPCFRRNVCNLSFELVATIDGEAAAVALHPHTQSSFKAGFRRTPGYGEFSAVIADSRNADPINDGALLGDAIDRGICCLDRSGPVALLAGHRISLKSLRRFTGAQRR
jgi:hypothetical protein